MNPAGCGYLRNQVLRVLDIVLEHGDHGGVLLGEKCLRHRTTFFTHSDLFRMEQQTLHVSGWVSSCHKGDRQKGANLGANLTAIVLEGWLVTKNRVSVNGGIVEAEPLARINEELINCHWIHAGSFWNEVGCHVATWANGLGVKRLNATEVVTRMC